MTKNVHSALFADDCILFFDAENGEVTFSE